MPFVPVYGKTGGAGGGYDTKTNVDATVCHKRANMLEITDNTQLPSPVC